MNTLKTNAVLQNGKYCIEGVLGQGGFGITYLASQVALNRKVTIKEFFMKELCNRDEQMQKVVLAIALLLSSASPGIADDAQCVENTRAIAGFYSKDLG